MWQIKFGNFYFGNLLRTNETRYSDLELNLGSELSSFEYNVEHFERFDQQMGAGHSWWDGKDVKIMII